MLKYDTQRSYLAVNMIFVNEDGHIAMVLRKNTRWMNNFYALPGGKVEKDESFIDAAVRETEEEVGVKLGAQNLKHAVTIYVNADDEEPEPDMKWVHVIFEVRKWDGELINAEPDTHGELAWFDPLRVPENTVPMMKTAIEAWIKKEGYADHGW